MLKKKRRQVRKQADTAGAREKAFEAAIAGCVKATSVVNDAEALALSLLADAGWQIESLEGGHGRPYQFLLSADGACEQIVEAKSALGLVKAVRELGEPDLYPSVTEYIIEELAEEAELEEMLEAEFDAEILAAAVKKIVLVNGHGGDPWMTCKVRVFHDALATFHMSTKVIELPNPQLAILKGAQIVYVSGRGDIVALSEGENPYAGEGISLSLSFIQVKEACAGMGMEWKGNGGYNGNSGQFEYPEVVDTPANLFPHPVTAGLFKVAPHGVGTDPISGALIAPLGKVFELVNQVMGLSHRQKTIKSAAWAKQGWVAQVVTL